MDGIFSNPGRRIKSWAKALFVIGIVAAVISFIAMVAMDDDLFLAGLLTVAIGIAAGFVTALFLYAFGELVESSQENRDINRQILQTLGGSAPQAPQYAPQQSAPAAPRPAPVPSGDASSRIWYCRACGTASSSSYSTCSKCGLPKSLD